MQRGGSKIRSGEQQRGRRLAAAGSQKHVSRGAKKCSGGQQRGRKLAAAGGHKLLRGRSKKREQKVKNT